MHKWMLRETWCIGNTRRKHLCYFNVWFQNIPWAEAKIVRRFPRFKHKSVENQIAHLNLEILVALCNIRFYVLQRFWKAFCLGLLILILIPFCFRTYAISLCLVKIVCEFLSKFKRNPSQEFNARKQQVEFNFTKENNYLFIWSSNIYNVNWILCQHMRKRAMETRIKLKFFTVSENGRF